MPHPLFEKHRSTLDRALQAIAERGYWSPYPESASPRNYGEGAAEAGKAAFESLRGKPFPLDQAATTGQIGSERSPYGFELGITYPKADVDALFVAIDSAQCRMAQGRAGSVGRHVRRDSRSSEQAELPDRQRRDAHDRTGVHDGIPGGRARMRRIAAWRRSRMPGTRCARAATANWEKPQGKSEPLRTGQEFPHRAARRLACDRLRRRFPTWNGYPALFASLATGNSGDREAASGRDPAARDHGQDRAARCCRSRLRSECVTLVAARAGAPITQELALRPEVRIIDFTGSSHTAVGSRSMRGRRRCTPRKRA